MNASTDPTPDSPRITVSTRRIGATALLGMSAPPVNAFSKPLRVALFQALRTAIDDPGVTTIVVYGVGKGFSAGGDIKEFGTPAALEGPGLSSDIQALIESAGKPVIAAIHGFALGGGLETALACHYRVASRQSLVGTPEVGIGLIPLSATQRLPRLVGLAMATLMVLGAERHTTQSLSATLLFDRLSEDDSADAVLEAALALAADSALPTRRTRDLAVPALESAPADAPATPTVAQAAALRALRACAELDFDAGMQVARLAYEDCYSKRSPPGTTPR